MQPLRKIILDAPPVFHIPEEFQHKNIEIIVWPLIETSESKTCSLKELLVTMPDVGTDFDFERRKEFARKEVIWDI